MSQEPNATTSSPGGASAPAVDPKSVEGIFIEALAQAPGPARNEFLETACQGNADLRMRVEALLRAYSDAGSFLNQPAGDWRNPPLTAAAGSPSASIDEHGIPVGLLRPSDEPGVLGTVGPYQVRELIGRGGMGIVLRAFDAKLNRVVAVKVLAPELAAQPTARRRFLREAQAAAAVTHPHVVTIHAVDEDEWPYLVMEYIDGCSLQDKIERSGTLKLTEVLRIGTQIAEGLAAAHKQGLIHRDVKPANILLENGVERVKITDFGLARAADDMTLTRPGEIAGTPQYMSPEQASGERVDQRSDLFSLGCVLYAMCAGEPPFRADSIAAMVKKICDDTPRPLREIDPQLPDWLAAVIDRLLSKDPNQRFQTTAEVAQVLGDALAQVQAGQAVARPAIPLAIPSAVALAPTADRLTMPTWEKVVLVTLLVSVVIAMSAPIQIPSTGAGAVIGLSELLVPLILFWITRMDSMSSTRRVLLTVMVFFLGWAIGYNLWYHPIGFKTGDWLAVLGMLPVSVFWTRRLWRDARSARGLTPDDRGRADVSRNSQRNNASDARGAWHPWRLVGWLLVAVLLVVLLAPVIILTGLILPAYQRTETPRRVLVQTGDYIDIPAKEIHRESIPPHSISTSPTADANIVWGEAHHQVQLGWRVEPASKSYQPRDLLTVSLFLRNSGQEPIECSLPRTQILEKLSLDLDFRDAAGKQLPWRWGPAHKSGDEVSGYFKLKLSPNAPFALPPFIVAIGKLPFGNVETVMAELDLSDVPPPAVDVAESPPPPFSLTMKLSSFCPPGGDKAELASKPFTFRLAAPP